MKKTHRKDVVIARVIFAVICLILIAGITALIMHLFNGKKKAETQQTEHEVTDSIPFELPPTTEEPQEVEETQFLWTSTDVNLRAEPNTDCEVITVLPAETKLELLGEEEGWVKVSYNGQEGYVSSEFVVDSQPDTQEKE